MDTKIRFITATGFAVNVDLVLDNLSVDQMKRLASDRSRATTDVEIQVTPEFVFLAGLRPVTTVYVPVDSLNKYASIRDTGKNLPEIVIDNNTILREWVAAGMPDHWSRSLVSGKILPVRDLAGRFTKLL